MANSVDQDQTAQEQSDLGPHCLPLYLHKPIMLSNMCRKQMT